MIVVLYELIIAVADLLVKDIYFKHRLLHRSLLVYSMIFFMIYIQRPEDGNHNIRAMIGNGLRKDIWEAFQKRYKIPKIVEFFGATEGTAAFVNTWGRVGSCGRLSPLLVSL